MRVRGQLATFNVANLVLGISVVEVFVIARYVSPRSRSRRRERERERREKTAQRVKRNKRGV